MNTDNKEIWEKDWRYAESEQCVRANIDHPQGNAIENIMAHFGTKIRQIIAERDAAYDDIFKWLLGEKGDFPDLSQKPHYSFRTELRQRLSTLSGIMGRE